MVVARNQGAMVGVTAEPHHCRSGTCVVGDLVDKGCADVTVRGEVMGMVGWEGPTHHPHLCRLAMEVAS